MQGILLVVEGFDGSGKTTAVNALTKKLTAAGYEVINTRQPGGTPVAEKLRDILKTPSGETISKKVEFLLMTAARVQLMETVILPSVDKGMVVISDRHVESSMAYQGFDYDNCIQYLPLVNTFTIIVDTPLEVCLERTSARGDDCRFENRSREEINASYATYQICAADALNNTDSAVINDINTVDDAIAKFKKHLTATHEDVYNDISTLEQLVRKLANHRLIVKSDISMPTSVSFTTRKIMSASRNINELKKFLDLLLPKTPYTLTPYNWDNDETS